mgnify:FL=1
MGTKKLKLKFTFFRDPEQPRGISLDIIADNSQHPFGTLNELTMLVGKNGHYVIDGLPLRNSRRAIVESAVSSLKF